MTNDADTTNSLVISLDSITEQDQASSTDPAVIRSDLYDIQREIAARAREMNDERLGEIASHLRGAIDNHDFD